MNGNVSGRKLKEDGARDERTRTARDEQVKSRQLEARRCNGSPNAYTTLAANLEAPLGLRFAGETKTTGGSHRNRVVKPSLSTSRKSRQSRVALSTELANKWLRRNGETSSRSCSCFRSVSFAWLEPRRVASSGAERVSRLFLLTATSSSFLVPHTTHTTSPHPRIQRICTT